MSEKVLAIIAVALGTYIARFLPLKFKFGSSNKMKSFLSLSSTSVISALFATSVFTPDAPEFGIRAAALTPLILTFYRWRNFGLSIAVAVLSYYLIRVVM